ncbi:high affinity choline transporter 1-like [Fundulus diaphanus]
MSRPSAVSIIYTFRGGLYSVAYTDVFQFCFIFVSLGRNKKKESPVNVKIVALGGLSYQALYQRILSAASSAQGQVTCFAAAVFIAGVHSVVIEVMAADWNQTAYGLPPPFERGDAGKILPLALQQLTPPWVAVLGIGAVAAAVMSSMDSALLSSASMFTQNIYKTTFRKKASERELLWVIRISVLLVGLAGMGLAFGDDSVAALWFLSGDLLYCVIFPQLVCVLHFQRANTYGAFSGFVVGLLLRVLSGEPVLRIPPVLLYPGWREENNQIRQYFPYRTVAKLSSGISIIAVSWLLDLMFDHQLIPESWDFMQVFKKGERDRGG